MAQLGKTEPPTLVVTVAPAKTARVSLKPLEGVRVLAQCGVMTFHFFIHRGHFGEPALSNSVAAYPKVWNLAFHIGLGGLDLLFIMTALLATLSLVPSMEGARSPLKAVPWYWAKRVARIGPAFWASLVITHCFVTGGAKWYGAVPNADSAQLSYPIEACTVGGQLKVAAFLGHWLPMAGCGLQLWSQSTMMHYYLIAPVLLLAARPAAPGFRRRVAIGCGGVLALSLAYRTWGTLQTDLDLPVKFFSDAPADMMNAFLLIEVLHKTLWARAASMAIGTLLGLAILRGTNQTTHAKEDAQKTHGSSALHLPTEGLLTPRNIAAYCVAIFAFYWFQIVGGKHEPSHPKAASALYVIFMLSGGPVMCAALAATLLAILQRRGAAGRVIADFLGSPFWTPLADITYSAYLYHVQVHFWMWRWGIFPKNLVKSPSDWAGFSVELAGAWVGTYLFAFAARAVVERPAASFTDRLLRKFNPVQDQKPLITAAKAA
mmetsp:Transcript_6055/g.17324  ORF Transcript_6055/g.17324 Transcript_6055/m.17324 type:complete len:489 (-) Transcript_6055:359-1825(-)|eukprot:CAMPEP_0206141174 /NCGR_PEP_ID=MMETSP1473-20131121/12031_1 /ASSEMBLY_ACC=CAM_ASM_001109 /TAXON_ID=1461547 /ORGANISM="Stichococcus sp, Strain RCC1054" /LENGTH=488 /DNA_ID=CAMNT_0053535631 /DNA_START=379 /DNA_END=1845 /DNA_ORIENTATION=-